MYSFASILLVSFGGTELKPGRIAKSPATLGPSGVAVAAIGQASGAAGLSDATVPEEAIEKTGSEEGGPVVNVREHKQPWQGSHGLAVQSIPVLGRICLSG